MAENTQPPEHTDTRPLPDDTSSDEEPIAENLKVMEEEKRGTIPGSTTATAMALMCTHHTTVNPTVKRGKPIRCSKKTNKNPQSKSTQTHQN